MLREMSVKYLAPNNFSNEFIIIIFYNFFILVKLWNNRIITEDKYPEYT